MHFLFLVGTPCCITTIAGKYKSRTAYAKRMCKNPYKLDLFDEEYLEDLVEAETPLFFMSARVQQRVMEICRITDASLRNRQLELGKTAISGIFLPASVWRQGSLDGQRNMSGACMLPGRRIPV